MAEEKLFQASNKAKFINQIKSLSVIRDHILVTEMAFKERKLSSGIVLLNDDGKTTGIRPRWAKVYAVGPEQTEIQVGQWIFVEHGRWSRGIEVEVNDEQLTLRRVDPKSIIFVSDQEPDQDDTISDSVHAEAKTLGRSLY
jgi:hypothetical protein